MDTITFWRNVALDLNKMDHSKPSNSREQLGPCFSSRALAITYAAFHDAFKAGMARPRRYCFKGSVAVGAVETARAAAGRAAYMCLLHLYPSKAAFLDAKYKEFLTELDAMVKPPTKEQKEEGANLGNLVAAAILLKRFNDGSSNAAAPGHVSTNLPGAHTVDPLHTNQGFYVPKWGAVKPFVLCPGDIVAFRPPAPPALGSVEYEASKEDVRMVGSRENRNIDTEITEIGVFWAYDGASGIGTPPRLYNQILMAFAESENYDEEQKAELYALANLAMADASIQAKSSARSELDEFLSGVGALLFQSQVVAQTPAVEWSGLICCRHQHDGEETSQKK